MLGKKKFSSMKKLVKKVRVISYPDPEPSHSEYLLRDDDGGAATTSPTSTATAATTPPGTFVIYVGEDKQRFFVPTAYLSHPLFKILLEKAYNEFGFEQRNGLIVPCSLAAFHEVISAVECCNGKFDFGDMVEEFL